MDLLDSILDQMEKPPSVSDKQKAMAKKMKEQQEKMKKLEAERLKGFRTKVEAKIKQFLDNDALKEYRFQPMEKVYRSVIHDVAEMANVWSYSFGEEGVDRHIMIFKREHPPSDDQLNALRKGEEWNDEIAKRVQAERERQAKEDSEEALNRKKKDDFKPTTFYKDKYQHLIGKEAALEAAKKTESNDSNYGCVPSSNKRDQRSIEQAMADIRAKRKKLEEEKKLNEEKQKEEEGASESASV